MTKETWKDIEGYGGKYQVSNLGRVKSNNFHRAGCSGILKPTTNSKGYVYITFSKDGKRKQIGLHRVVAQAFCDNPDNLPQVDHINCNKEDNRAVNLEWVTAGENSKRAYKNGLTSQHIKDTSNAITLVDRKILAFFEFSSQREASCWLGFKPNTVAAAICNCRKYIKNKQYLIVNWGA